MPKLIASRPLTYAGRTILAGEEFDADEPYATTLVSLGRVSRVGGDTKAKPTSTKGSDKAEEQQKDEPAEKPAAKPKAKAEDTGYSTRRLKAKK